MSARTAHLDLRGKVVAITGGARGIGLATANAFAQRGALVAIGDLDAAGARVAAERIGRGATGLALDVTDRVSFESFLNEVEHRLGPLDVMVNNAGIQHVGLFADETEASTDIQIAVNLGGVLTGTKLALARMRPRGRGHIVNVASLGGKIASPGGATYSATKHAVVGLSESLRGELGGSSIAVSIVMPAIIQPRWLTGSAQRVACARSSRLDRTPCCPMNRDIWTSWLRMWRLLSQPWTAVPPPSGTVVEDRKPLGAICLHRCNR
jgi:NAD(P)-dependent dehydrogenase (short-subunit alcohol dehydrogenase family)